MAKIAKRTYQFQSVPADAKTVRVYYKKVSDGPLDYDSPFVQISAVPGPMNIALPDQVPITDGEWALAATILDDAGNESDMGAAVQYPFDFVAPAAPTEGKIL